MIVLRLSKPIYCSIMHQSRLLKLKCNFSSAQPNLQPNLKNESSSSNIKTITYFENKGDILLFSFENQRKFTVLNISALLFYLYCANLSYYAIKKMYDDEDEFWQEKKEKWYSKYNVSKDQAKYGVAAAAAIIGVSTLGMTWMHTLRTVKYLFLNKDASYMTIVTYLPFKSDRFVKVPIANILCKQNRFTAKNKLELNVKGKVLNYVIDLKGNFRNPNLFDSTIAVMK